jgi:hypothetical protein
LKGFYYNVTFAGTRKLTMLERESSRCWNAKAHDAGTRKLTMLERESSRCWNAKAHDAGTRKLTISFGVALALHWQVLSLHERTRHLAQTKLSEAEEGLAALRSAPTPISAPGAHSLSRFVPP